MIKECVHITNQANWVRVDNMCMMIDIGLCTHSKPGKMGILYECVHIVIQAKWER